MPIFSFHILRAKSIHSIIYREKHCTMIYDQQVYQRFFGFYGCTCKGRLKTPLPTKLFSRRLSTPQIYKNRKLLSTSRLAKPSPSPIKTSSDITNVPSDWEESPNRIISQFSELPNPHFGINQHIAVVDELRENLNQILSKFKAPIPYAFAYGSGVFAQSNQSSTTSSAKSIHTKAPLPMIKTQTGTAKMIDFIFGVTDTQHWHLINLAQHRDHYSMLGLFGSGIVSKVQDSWGAGVYFNPYVTVNGLIIKYGVVNVDTLCTDLSQWESLYLAGRLQKPVKILRDNPRVRLANQFNLISALRTALLLLPSEFTEIELYSTITSISYTGDPRMILPAENPLKVANIVRNNLPNFRQLYSPLLKDLPNIFFRIFKSENTNWFSDSQTNHYLAQDMDPQVRGGMIRRLPMSLRSKLFSRFQKKYQISQLEYDEIYESFIDEDINKTRKWECGDFERRIANESLDELRSKIRGVIQSTVSWPSTTQSIKGLFTAGMAKTWIYTKEKMAKNRQGRQQNIQI